jgi:uncharacterized protein (TIGR03118 family)
MSLKHPQGLHDARDLLQDPTNDPGMVPMADLEDDLRDHRPVTTFLQTDLVSTDGSVMGTVRDPNLVNPWGMSDTGGGSPIWISQNGVALTSLYSVVHNANTGVDTVTPNAARAPVHVVTTAGVPLSPTGQVFNPFNGANGVATAFVLSNGKPATFMFATEQGSIAGWNATLPGAAPGAPLGTQTVTAVSTPGADYTGLAIDKAGDTPMLYAANFSQGEVDVFDGGFHKIDTITDNHGSSHLSPFNVQVLTVQGVERLFVTFASNDAVSQGNMSGDEHGGGFVDEFDLQGNLIQRIDSDGTLNSPWGLAIAPSSFGSYAGDLLVGNHGDGTISVFDLNAGDDQALGHLLDNTGHAITIPDLFGLIPGETTAAGVANNGGSPNTIYFTAGGAHGLFGSLTPNGTLPIGMGESGGHS